MSNIINNKNNRKSFFDYFTEVLGWLQIVASPLLVGLIVGFLIYISEPNRTRLFIGIVVAVVGLITGIIWATSVWKKQGTINFVSRISATPDLDKTEGKEVKDFDLLYDDLGKFIYEEDGFIYQSDNGSENIKWSEIEKLAAYKVDFMTFDKVLMDIVMSNTQQITISEDIPGWYQFVKKTKEIFPTIPKEWDMDIIHPAFATNYTILYEKK